MDDEVTRRLRAVVEASGRPCFDGVVWLLDRGHGQTELRWLTRPGVAVAARTSTVRILMDPDGRPVVEPEDAPAPDLREILPAGVEWRARYVRRPLPWRIGPVGMPPRPGEGADGEAPSPEASGGG